MGFQHTAILVERQSIYLSQIDPITRQPFRTGEMVVICSMGNEPVKLSSIQENKLECPHCREVLSNTPAIGNPTWSILSGLANSNAYSKVDKLGDTTFPTPASIGSYVPWLAGIGVTAFLFMFFVVLIFGGNWLSSLFGQSSTPPNSDVTQAPPTSASYKSPTPTLANLSSSNNGSATLSDPDGWIVYAYGTDQIGGQGSNSGRDLYMINWRSGSKVQLTTGNMGNNFPSFAPDGRQVVFSGCRPNCDLYVLDSDSNSEIKLPTNNAKAMWPNWCPLVSKPWIVYESRTNSGTSIWMIDISNNNTIKLTDGPADGRPVWSPDCTQVLFGRASRDTTGDGKVTTNDMLDPYIYSLSSQSFVHVLDTPSADEFGFAWSPGINQIAFTQVSRDTDGNGKVNLNDQSELYIYDLKSGQKTNITNAVYSAFTPSFSSDGTLLIFTAYYGLRNRIVVYSLESSEFTEITPIDEIFHARWIP